MMSEPANACSCCKLSFLELQLLPADFPCVEEHFACAVFGMTQLVFQLPKPSMTIIPAEIHCAQTFESYTAIVNLTLEHLSRSACT